jgi:hypothetical protein
MVTIIFDWPSSIQASAAVAIVVLTAWTLKVLREYAADTKKIAETGTAQIEHSHIQLENTQMPFLAIVKEPGTPQKHAGWYLQNQGFGPALNIMFTGDSNGNEPVMKPTAPLRAGEDRFENYDIERVVARFRRFEAHYESLSGLKYKTTVIIEGNDRMNVQFYKAVEDNRV